MKLTLLALSYFQKTAELQHLTRAAEALHISQPSLSHTIKVLETELGVPLFSRSGRNIVLTKYGEILLRHTNRIMQELHGAQKELADTKERLDTPIANAPQLRVAYLTAWPTADGVAAFRRDVYELDGTGFVVGQPLPVGESQGGQRFVLKPIPRSLEAVDSDEAFGFASLFRSSRNTDKQDSTAMAGRRSKSSDSLLPGSKTTKTTAKDGEAGKSKTVRTASGKKPGKFMVRNGNSDKEANFAHMFAAQDSSAKKPLKKSGAKTKSKTTLASKTAGKTSDKSKTAKAETDKASTAKKVVKKDETTVAAKKPETAAKTAAKTAAADAKSATDAKAKKPAATATAKKPATAQCKPGTDGKLPSGCKTPSTAKKPEPKPEKTASAAN